MNIQQEIDSRINQAMRCSGIPGNFPAKVVQAAPDFGDWQANGIMEAAKQMGVNPRQLAQDVVDAVNLSDLAAKVMVSRPGFITIELKWNRLPCR